MAGGRKAYQNGMNFEEDARGVCIDANVAFKTNPKIYLSNGLCKRPDLSFKGIDGLTYVVECRYQEVAGTTSDKIDSLIISKFYPIYDSYQPKIGGLYIVVNGQMAVSKSSRHLFYDNKAYLYKMFAAYPDFVSLIQLLDIDTFSKYVKERGVPLEF